MLLQQGGALHYHPMLADHFQAVGIAAEGLKSALASREQARLDLSSMQTQIKGSMKNFAQQLLKLKLALHVASLANDKESLRALNLLFPDGNPSSIRGGIVQQINAYAILSDKLGKLLLPETVWDKAQKIQLDIKTLLDEEATLIAQIRLHKTAMAAVEEASTTLKKALQLLGWSARLVLSPEELEAWSGPVYALGRKVKTGGQAPEKEASSGATGTEV
jgi:hypothetical protein